VSTARRPSRIIRWSSARTTFTTPLPCAAEATDLLADAEEAEASTARLIARCVRIEADAAILHVDLDMIVGSPERHLRRWRLRVLEHVHDELAHRAEDDGLGGVVERLVRPVVCDLDLEPVALLDVLGEPRERLFEAEIVEDGWT
jgi:hypothetical protein